MALKEMRNTSKNDRSLQLHAMAGALLGVEGGGGSRAPHGTQPSCFGTLWLSFGVAFIPLEIPPAPWC